MTERGRAWVFTGVGGLLREGLAGLERAITN